MDIKRYDEATKLRNDIFQIDCFIKDLPKIRMYMTNSTLAIFTSMYMTTLPSDCHEEVLDIIEKFFIEKKKELMKEFEKI